MLQHEFNAQTLCMCGLFPAQNDPIKKSPPISLTKSASVPFCYVMLLTSTILCYASFCTVSDKGYLHVS